jgi:UDP-N-acetylmuramyl tripeptide synthase
MEEVENKKGYKIFIDYAHTPDALKQVLETSKQID